MEYLVSKLSGLIGDKRAVTALEYAMIASLDRRRLRHDPHKPGHQGKPDLQFDQFGSVSLTHGEHRDDQRGDGLHAGLSRLCRSLEEQSE